LTILGLIRFLFKDTPSVTYIAVQSHQYPLSVKFLRFSLHNAFYM
jgi:hypothetical protein